MEYYVDIDFAVSFVMDYAVLRLVRNWMGYRADTNVALGVVAGMGALIQVIIRCFGDENAFLLLGGMLLAPFLMGIMINKRHHEFMRIYLCMWFVCFVLGGANETIRNTLQKKVFSYSDEKGSVMKSFFVSGIIMIAAVLFVKAVVLVGREMRKNKIYTLELDFGDKQIRCKGLMDTGNCLYEPFFGKPVMVAIGYDLTRQLEEIMHEKPEQTCVIPYYSVGREGVLGGIRVKRIVLYTERGEITERNVIVAKGELKGTKRKYQLILHPDLIPEMAG